MPNNDTLFIDDSKIIDDFNFDENTAAVFDDMLDRSIPQYHELQRMIAEIAAEFAQPNTTVYDLGCSTGITIDNIRQAVASTGKQVKMVGLDYSQPMLDRAKDRFAALPDDVRPMLASTDFNHGCVIENASVVVLNLTLQFIRPLYRDQLIRSIVSGLDDNGCLILVEKVLSADSLLNRMFIKLYYDMKRRNGYSKTEISRKREALENVLIPYRVDENIEMLKRNGFAAADTFFKWHNFAGIVAVKKARQ